MATQEGPVLSRRITIAFAALALASGPVMMLLSPAFSGAVRWQVVAGDAVASLIGSGVLLLAARLRGELLWSGRRWAAMLVLIAPRLATSAVEELLRPRLHDTGGGVEFLIALAASLWLGLLASAGLIRCEVPRAAMGGGIAGVGAALLLVPASSYALAANQIPMLVVHLLIGIGVVYTWWFARERLAGAPVLACAGAYLLINGAVSAVLSLVGERSGWRTVEWREALIPVLLKAMVLAASFSLWMYLLTRMRLAAFSLHPLAAWAAGICVGLPMVFLASWRADAAAAIAIVALVIGLRARVEDEQPTALGLGGT